MSDLEYGCTEYEMPCPAAGGIPCGSERCVRSGECEEEAERYLIRDGEVQYAWLIWGRQPGSGSKPLGCYATREVALAAEEMMRALPEAAEWEDIWTTPWPLATVPKVNFRMLRPTSRAQDA